MSDLRDPKALARHAIQAGDWRLVALMACRLSDQANPSRLGARRAYRTLVAMLGLSGDSGDYHRP
jgi:hypothetical protein